MFRDVDRSVQGHRGAARSSASSARRRPSSAVARRLVLNKGPLKDGFDRPDGVLLFLGPTGVGKTELAKAVAEFLFGDEKKMIRVDMSEYQDGGVAVDKLIGMPRGIVGSERGGILTNQLKDNPYTVVLLDEVEKASPSLLNLFLQAFDEGWLTDGRGKRVYLSDAVVIMTSNIGSEHFRKLTSPLGFLSRQRRRRAGAGRGHARARAPVPAGVPEPHRRGRALRAADARRSAARSRSTICDRSSATLAKARQDAARSTTRRSSCSSSEGYSLAFGARFLKRVIDERDQAADQRSAGRTASHFEVRVDGGRGRRRDRRRQLMSRRRRARLRRRRVTTVARAQVGHLQASRCTSALPGESRPARALRSRSRLSVAAPALRRRPRVCVSAVALLQHAHHRLALPSR